MRHRFGRTLALVASAVALALPVQAQTRGIFAGAGVIADNDQTNSRLTDNVATSWTIVLGVDATDHVGIRFLLDPPRDTRAVSETVVRRSPLGLPTREQLTRTRRSMTYGVLADLHAQISGRFRLAMTFGFSAVTHDEEVVVVRQELQPDGSSARLPDLRQAGDFDWNGLALGVEAPFAASRRIQIVPEVRMIYFGFSESPHPYIVRSGVGVRWRF